MYLYADIGVITDGIPNHADTSNSFICPLRVGLMQVVVRRERREPNCREALLLGAYRIGCEFLASDAVDMHVATHLVPSLAAHKVVDGSVESFALQVPQRDVDGR